MSTYAIQFKSLPGMEKSEYRVRALSTAFAVEEARELAKADTPGATDADLEVIRVLAVRH